MEMDQTTESVKKIDTVETVPASQIFDAPPEVVPSIPATEPVNVPQIFVESPADIPDSTAPATTTAEPSNDAAKVAGAASVAASAPVSAPSIVPPVVSLQKENAYYTLVPNASNQSYTVVVGPPANVAGANATAFSTNVPANIFGPRSQFATGTTVPISAPLVDLKTRPQVVNKRGVAKVTASNGVSTTAAPTMVPAMPQKPVLVKTPVVLGANPASNSVGTVGGAFVKLIQTNQPTTILVPSGVSPPVNRGTATAAAAVPPAVRAASATVTKAAPKTATTSVAQVAAATRKPAPQRLPPASASKILPQSAFQLKSSPTKILTATEKSIQQRKLLADNVAKYKKLERSVVVAHGDQATPMTYGEIFHQAAVSFSKLSSLTAHVSLERHTPAEQHRWSPDLVGNFMTSVSTFASSLKEVGDELKKRHTEQLTKNLKRKAEEELASAKRIAVESTVKTCIPPSSDARGAALTNGGVQLTNHVEAASTSSNGTSVPPLQPSVTSEELNAMITPLVEQSSNTTLLADNGSNDVKPANVGDSGTIRPLSVENTVPVEDPVLISSTALTPAGGTVDATSASSAGDGQEPESKSRTIVQDVDKAEANVDEPSGDYQSEVTISQNSGTADIIDQDHVNTGDADEAPERMVVDAV